MMLPISSPQRAINTGRVATDKHQGCQTLDGPAIKEWQPPNNKSIAKISLSLSLSFFVIPFFGRINPDPILSMSRERPKIGSDVDFRLGNSEKIQMTPLFSPRARQCLSFRNCNLRTHARAGTEEELWLQNLTS